MSVADETIDPVIAFAAADLDRVQSRGQRHGRAPQVILAPRHRRLGLASPRDGLRIRPEQPRHDLDRTGSGHLVRVGRPGDEPNITRRDDLDMRPGGIQPPEAPADHPVLDTDDGEARRAAILLDLRGRAGRAVQDTAVVQQLVIMGVPGIDEGDLAIDELARDRVAVRRQVAGIGVHEHQRHLPLGLRARQLLGQPVAMVHGQPEVGTTRPRRHDIEEQAAMARNHLRLGPVGPGYRRFVIGQVARLEIMVAGNDPPWQRQRRERLHHPGILSGRAVIGVVAGYEDEIRRAHLRIDLRDDLAESVEALPVIGFVQMQVTDMDPGDAAHALASSGLAPPEQAGRSVPAKPIHSPRLATAKPPRI